MYLVHSLDSDGFKSREALTQMALSQDNILTLPMGHVVEFFFPRDSKEVSGHFAGISNLLDR